MRLVFVEFCTGGDVFILELLVVDEIKETMLGNGMLLKFVCAVRSGIGSENVSTGMKLSR